MIINTDRLYWYTSSMGHVEFQLPGQCVIDCMHTGDCEPEVSYWVPELDLSGVDPASLISELDEYGAWEEGELQDHDQNLARIVWLAAGDLQDEISQGEHND